MCVCVCVHSCVHAYIHSFVRGSSCFPAPAVSKSPNIQILSLILLTPKDPGAEFFGLGLGRGSNGGF